MALTLLASITAPSIAADPVPRAGGSAAADRPGVTEHVGADIPGDIFAVDDRGRSWKLADLADRPVILALVYYSCEHVCPQALGALGQLASGLPLTPGADYRLVTFSFDAADTPQDAAEAKRNYIKPLGPGFPAEAWTFLTASPENIGKLTDSLGFRFKKQPHGFIHPSVLVILGPGGRISGYIHVSRTAYGVGYPVMFSPVSIGASLRRAAAGGSEAKDPAPLLFCYPHEPEGQPRFYGVLSALGAVTLAFLGGLFLYLAVGRKRPRAAAK
ncbi:MAG: SCO family protein [Candidatus Aminicenantales bacterium]